ncbi:phenylalanine--tRNA ligase subunit alpha [Hydrogenophilus hirschii]|jgi:phenylalanyl-tRNA synthetase alpha chain|nr:phenylalanine--tRNA ligase subunit alpha [Hydrogenophilus thermoluteolus]
MGSEWVREAEAAFAAATTVAALEDAKARFLGKNGVITNALKGLGKLPPEKRKAQGAAINAAKARIEALLEAARARLEAEQLARSLAAQAIDVTLPGRHRSVGAPHPVWRTLERVEALFASLGFSVADGPEIEDDWHNFTALNTPEDHPARSMHDTFYLEGRSDVVLRTHTSPVQIRAMRAHVAAHGAASELRIIAPGRVYRVDSDATHSPMFHQLEGLWVGPTIAFTHLKGVVQAFLHAFFETDALEVRFRPSFFPFTEPSAEIDVRFMSGALKGKWLEIAGCGMVHPTVLANGGFDPEQVRGFAFGFGLDRLAMLQYGINDLRLFFENDVRFLAQFA